MKGGVKMSYIKCDFIKKIAERLIDMSDKEKLKDNELYGVDADWYVETGMAMIAMSRDLPFTEVVGRTLLTCNTMEEAFTVVHLASKILCYTQPSVTLASLFKSLERWRH